MEKKGNNNGNGNSENDSSTNYIKNVININQINIKKAEKLSKNDLIQKIDNLFKDLTEDKDEIIDFNKIYKIINETNELKLEDAIKKEKDFKKNEISKIKLLIKLENKIFSNKDNLKKVNVINVEAVFTKWKNSFNQSYRATEVYKFLVIFDNEIMYEDLKKAAKDLINGVGAKIKIFKEDPGNSSKYISEKKYNGN